MGRGMIMITYHFMFPLFKRFPLHFTFGVFLFCRELLIGMTHPSSKLFNSTTFVSLSQISSTGIGIHNKIMMFIKSGNAHMRYKSRHGAELVKMEASPSKCLLQLGMQYKTRQERQTRQTPLGELHCGLSTGVASDPFTLIFPVKNIVGTAPQCKKSPQLHILPKTHTKMYLSSAQTDSLTDKTEKTATKHFLVNCKFT